MSWILFLQIVILTFVFTACLSVLMTTWNNSR